MQVFLVTWLQIDPVRMAPKRWWGEGVSICNSPICLCTWNHAENFPVREAWIHNLPGTQHTSHTYCVVKSCEGIREVEAEDILAPERRQYSFGHWMLLDYLTKRMSWASKTHITVGVVSTYNMTHIASPFFPGKKVGDVGWNSGFELPFFSCSCCEGSS